MLHKYSHNIQQNPIKQTPDSCYAGAITIFIAETHRQLTQYNEIPSAQLSVLRCNCVNHVVLRWLQAAPFWPWKLHLPDCYENSWVRCNSVCINTCNLLGANHLATFLRVLFLSMDPNRPLEKRRALYTQPTCTQRKLKMLFVQGFLTASNSMKTPLVIR